MNKLALRVLRMDTCPFARVSSKSINGLLEVGKVDAFGEGALIFNKGDKSGWFYVLLQGSVMTQVNDVDVRSLTVGEVGGLTSCLTSSATRSMAHRSTASDTLILRVTQKFLHEELMKDTDFNHAVIEYLNSRVRVKTSAISVLVQSRRSEPKRSDKALPAFRIAVFDTKPYDQKFLTESFAKQVDGATATFALSFFPVKLDETTAMLAGGHDAVCIFVNDTCNDAVLGLLETLGIRLVLLRCAGFNNVSLVRASQLGISLARVPAYSPYAVAEHAAALLLTVNRKTHTAFGRVRSGNFTLSGLEGRDLHGGVAGIAGTGKIGKCFAAIARGFGMKLLAYDPYPDAKWAAAHGVTYCDNFQDMAARCDVLSLHLPLTPETKNLVNGEVLAKMKSTAILINTSRGQIIDAKALLEAVLEGRIAGAGLDVYENETQYFFEDRSSAPLKDDVLARLTNLPNVVITAHQAFLTHEALSAIASTTFSNAVEYAFKGKRGKHLSNCVLPPPDKSKL